MKAVVGLCPLGLRVFDYTDVAAFGGDAAGFWDGAHADPASYALMVAQMSAGTGDACAVASAS